ncbi:MAG TPA: cytochrome c biogenesis protein CcdA [Gaiellaceae bacterium]|nr:cytochrome c biogenesis protein CcdA [Gaiellaceae bacterium]
MGGVPVSVALAAGGLAVVNPCAFPLLPAFLSFYLGVEEERLPRTTTRVAQGLAVGALVSAGFLGLFALAGLPIAFGVGAIARAVPWAGLVTGVLLGLAGLAALAGFHVAAPVRLGIRPRRERRLGAIVLFGVGYGAASLGCTLPVFLALIGASLGGSKVAVFTAYGVGMAIVMMALAVTVALLREGLVRSIRPFLRFAERAAGALLVVAGAYLTYYWARIKFGDIATLSADPVVGFVTRYAAQVQDDAAGRAWLLLAVAGALIGAAACFSLWQRRRHGVATRELVRE